MEYQTLCRDITVSRVGFGTGSSGFTGITKQACMTVKALSDILLYAYDRGVNFWDTSYTYGTYPHIREALACVPRGKVVLATKFSDNTRHVIEKKLDETLKALRTDYVDICLLHGVRSTFDLKMRAGAIEALARAKEKGYIKKVGISAHGISALGSALDVHELEVVFARVNWDGRAMDSYQEGFVSKVIAFPYVKEIVRSIIPRRIIGSFSARIESPRSTIDDQEAVKALLMRLHDSGKSVIGIKVFGAGLLAKEAEKSIRFAMSQGYLDSFILGMASKEEVDINLSLYEKILKESLGSLPQGS